MLAEKGTTHSKKTVNYDIPTQRRETMPAKVVEGKVVDSYRFSGPAGKIMRQAIPQDPQ
jgi:hypothetical protein